MKRLMKEESVQALCYQYGLPKHFSHWEQLHPQILLFAPGETLIDSERPTCFSVFSSAGKRKDLVPPSSKENRSHWNCFKGGKPGASLLGEIEFITGLSTPNITSAVTELTCAALPLTIDGDTLRHDPIFLTFLCRVMAEKLTENKSQTARMACPLQARVADYLAFTAQDGLICGGLTEAAALCNGSYRQFMRVLGDLCRRAFCSGKTGANTAMDRRRWKTCANGKILLLFPVLRFCVIFLAKPHTNPNGHQCHTGNDGIYPPGC